MPATPATITTQAPSLFGLGKTGPNGDYQVVVDTVRSARGLLKNATNNMLGAVEYDKVHGVFPGRVLGTFVECRLHLVLVQPVAEEHESGKKAGKRALQKSHYQRPK